MDGHDDGLVLVPPGCYELEYASHTQKKTFSTYKLYLNFRITDDGPHQGKIATRYYAITMSEAGKARGRFGFGWFSAGLREHVLLFGELPQRNTDISIEKYKSNIFLGKIATVTRDYKKRDKPELLHNSKVAELIRIVRPRSPQAVPE